MIQRVPVWRDDAQPLRLELLVSFQLLEPSDAEEFPVGNRVRWWDGTTYAEQGTVRRNDGTTILVQVDPDASFDPASSTVPDRQIVNEAGNFGTTVGRIESVFRDITIAPGDFVVIEGFDKMTCVATPLSDAPFRLELLEDITGGAPAGVYTALIGSGETPWLGIPLPSVEDAEPVSVVAAAFEQVSEILDASRRRTIHAVVPYQEGKVPLMLRYPISWRLRRVSAVLDQGAGDLAIYTVDGPPFEGDFIKLSGPFSPSPFDAFLVTDEIATWDGLDSPPSPTGALWIELTDVSGDPTSLTVAIEIEEEET